MDFQLEAASEPPVTFQDFPAELIEKVFVYSLPDDALDQTQPNVRIAPILLCHVCSQWRSIAFQLPGLWMCLNYIVCLPPHLKEESGLLKRGIRPIALEFLEWWWCHLGATHPFHLRLHVYFHSHPEDGLSVQDSEDLLVNLFNLARHLDVNQSAAGMIHGNSIPFPNLQTLCIRNISHIISLASELIPVQPNHPIRKFHMQHLVLREPDVFERPILSWSSLTHVVIADVYLSTRTWFDLIRACVNLQFGYFHIHLDRSSEEPRSANPPNITHRLLRQLVVIWDNGDDVEYMLKNLYLPSLAALRIFAGFTTHQLHCILQSMPSLVELHFGCVFSADGTWYPPVDGDFPEPLSKYGPNLRHFVIQTHLFAYCWKTMTEDIDTLISSSWLQLGVPMGTVRTLEIRVAANLPRGPREELDSRPAVNPSYGWKVSVVDSNGPVVWISSTAFEKSEATYFEGANFGRGPGCAFM